MRRSTDKSTLPHVSLRDNSANSNDSTATSCDGCDPGCLLSHCVCVKKQKWVGALDVQLDTVTSSNPGNDDEDDDADVHFCCCQVCVGDGEPWSYAQWLFTGQPGLLW